MINIIEKIKSFVYYKYPVTEYVVGTAESIDETILIMDACPFTFTPWEAFKLFLTRYARVIISISLTCVLWILYGETLATELFYAFHLPSWMLQFCLWGAASIFSNVLNELMFGYQ